MTAGREKYGKTEKETAPTKVRIFPPAGEGFFYRGSEGFEKLFALFVVVGKAESGRAKQMLDKEKFEFGLIGFQNALFLIEGEDFAEDGENIQLFFAETCGSHNGALALTVVVQSFGKEADGFGMEEKLGGKEKVLVQNSLAEAKVF